MKSIQKAEETRKKGKRCENLRVRLEVSIPDC